MFGQNDDTDEDLTSRVTFDAVAGVEYQIAVDGFDNAEGAIELHVNSTRPVVSVVASAATAAERGFVEGSFTLTRIGSPESPLSVKYSITGTATNGLDFAQLSGVAQFPAGAASVALPVRPLPDTLAEGPETVVLTLVGDAGYNVATARTDTVTIDDQPIDAWRFATFGGDVPGGMDLDDFDGDGICNLEEYALNLDARTAEFPKPPVILRETVAGTEYLTLIFLKSSDRPDVSIRVEKSEDGIQTWAPLSDEVVGVSGSDEMHRARVPLDGGSKMLRLRITRP